MTAADSSVCSHLEKAANRHAPAVPSSQGCAECLRAGGVWVHLRLCLSCGHVGCCDNSPNRHATKHFHATKHPVIRSYEPGEDWGYCYPDEMFLEVLPARPGEAAPRHFDPPED
jgi:uncharacterized UBP type Zn finger protein